jgi:hypothetical protein
LDISEAVGQQSTLETPEQSCSAARTAESAPPSYQSYLGDTGYMGIFSTDNAECAPATVLLMERHYDLDDIPSGLLRSYLETYFGHIYIWCPILDRESRVASGDLAATDA